MSIFKSLLSSQRALEQQEYEIMEEDESEDMQNIADVRSVRAQSNRVRSQSPDPPPQWDAEGNLCKYYLTLGQGPNYADGSIAWSLTLPPPFYANTPIYGIIRKGTIIMPFQPVPTTTPTTLVQSLQPRITILVQGIKAYYYKSGILTDAVACFNLSNVLPVTFNNISYVHAIYTLEEDQQFTIPVGFQDLNIQIAYDGAFLPLPFPTEIPLMLDLSTRRERQTLKITKEEIDIDF